MSIEDRFSLWGPRTARSIRNFQAYVLDCVYQRASSWPNAKMMIQCVADDVHEDLGAEPLPVSLGDIMTMFGVSMTIEHREISSGAAKIVPVRGGFHVTIFHVHSNSNAHSDLTLDFEALIESAPVRDGNRTRFTVAHELGHTLFYRAEGSLKPPSRIIPQPPSFGPNKWREEGLCHDFARALLIPKHVRSLVSGTPHIGVIVDLVRALRVTPEPLVRRIMYDWGLWPDTVFIQITKSERTLQTKLFRGTHQRARRRTMLTARDFEKEFADVRTLSEAEALLTQKKLLRNHLSFRGSQSLWGLLAV
jgi:Zn-dependent peptidase ImmA (M78 family)